MGRYAGRVKACLIRPVRTSETLITGAMEGSERRTEFEVTVSQKLS